MRHHNPLIASGGHEWTTCDLESSIQFSHRPLPAHTAQLHGVKVAGDDGSGCKTVSKRPGTSRWAECTAASKYPCRCSSASTTASKTTELARDRSLAMRVLREPPPVRAPCASNAALVTQTNWYSTAVIKQNNPSRSSQKWRPAWRWHLFVAQNDLPGYVPPLHATEELGTPDEGVCWKERLQRGRPFLGRGTVLLPSVPRPIIFLLVGT